MKKKFGILLSFLTIPSAAISSCFISSCSNGWDKFNLDVYGKQYDTQTKTLTLNNSFYNPLSTKIDKLVYDVFNLSASAEFKTCYKVAKTYEVDLSKAPQEILPYIETFKTVESSLSEIQIRFYTSSTSILTWDEFPITINYSFGDSLFDEPNGSYTFNVAAQIQNNTYKLDHTRFTGEFNSTKTEIAWTGTYQDCGSINGHPNSPDNGWFLWNIKNIEFTSDERGRYIYDNCFNFIETKHPDAPVSPGGVFGNIGPYTSANLWYDISLPMNDLLWNWVWGTEQDLNSGNIKNLIIDDYDNNPNWKEDGYKTLQIGNPYTWRSWNKMFYKCYSLLPSLHYYFDNFTNEVPIAKDGSSTGEPGTPTETYRFTPEDVDAMVYGY